MASLDGYVEGEDHDLSWHQVDAEFNDFAVKQLQEADTILMGRKTYQLMESFWPSPAGLEDDPLVAKLMNETPKVVVSKTLEKVTETETWKQVTLVKENFVEKIHDLKEKDGKNIIVLGSNNLCVTLLKEHLLDEIRIMVNPVVIGKGAPLFEGLQNKEKFTLVDTRVFENGNVLLTYQVVKN